MQEQNDKTKEDKVGRVVSNCPSFAKSLALGEAFVALASGWSCGSFLTFPLCIDCSSVEGLAVVVGAVLAGGLCWPIYSWPAPCPSRADDRRGRIQPALIMLMTAAFN